MKKSKFYLIIIVLIFPIIGYSQVAISPYLSVGYMNHLTRNGINSELGVDFEIIKRINVSTSFRYSLLDKGTENEIEVKAASLFLSYVILNQKHHKLMIGPGISYGNYKRYTENIGGFEKEYKDYWFNPLKLRYDYIFSSKIKIGLDASLYGDDGDGGTYLGLVCGYVF
jgi:hypothetical protein